MFFRFNLKFCKPKYWVARVCWTLSCRRKTCLIINTINTFYIQYSRCILWVPRKNISIASGGKFNLRYSHEKRISYRLKQNMRLTKLLFPTFILCIFVNCFPYERLFPKCIFAIKIIIQKNVQHKYIYITLQSRYQIPIVTQSSMHSKKKWLFYALVYYKKKTKVNVFEMISILY